MNMGNWFVVTLINKNEIYYYINVCNLIFSFTTSTITSNTFSNLLMSDQMVLIYSVENQLYQSMNLCYLNYLGIVVWKRFLMVHQMPQAAQQKILNFI